MDKQAKWIWHFGDFELYHHMILSCRRQEKGCDYPCMWYLSQPERSVVFQTTFYAASDSTINICSHSKGMIRLNGNLYNINKDIQIKEGNYEIVVELYDLEKFPSLYCNSEYLITDESWTCNCCDRIWNKVCCEPAYTSQYDDPSIFPFLYETIKPVKVSKFNDGLLYDFGKEYFGPVEIKDLKENEEFDMIYGESFEEATDPENAIIRDHITSETEAIRPSRAFRYIYVTASKNIIARYEYLPITDKASFVCDNEIISSIWDICSYTFHLNSREFYLDGIKRDRWVWSGDAYQSFLINRYLYSDNSITKRTLIALLGKPPYRRHINFINDYSSYLIMAFKDYLFETGDVEFISNVYDNIKELYSFIISRLDAKGYITGLDGDWIFIDWGVLDKEGPICAEQILLLEVYKSMSFFADIFNENDIYNIKAKELKQNILNDYWCEDKGAFIDSYTSGKNFTSRQTNVFAVLFDVADKIQTESIIKNVFNNDHLPQITTPYFKLYELMALCKIGFVTEAQQYIETYWGGMLKEGATTVWEAYDPQKKGAEHYEMYGNKFGKSLCHAWGSGPILLLGKYCAGVDITTIGGKTFTVAPNPGKYKYFKAEVPVNNSTVKIEYNDGTLKVMTDIKGGSLIFNEKKYIIERNRELIIQ